MITSTTPYGALALRVSAISLGCALAAFLITGCDQSANDQSQWNAESTTESQTHSPAADDLAMQNSPVRNPTSADQYSNQMDDGMEEGYDDNEQGQLAIVGAAVAEVEPTEGYEANGSVSFVPNDAGTEMDIHIALSGLSPGLHGLHIHENGDCSAPDASSAGDHFNPDGEMHGSPQDTSRHVGDLGNIEADASGSVETTLTINDRGFSGPTSFLEKAIVVHAQADDLETDPAGNSGDRVGCGVIRQNAAEMASLSEDDSPIVK